jgi:hypothetical protein
MEEEGRGEGCMGYGDAVGYLTGCGWF